MNFIHCDNAHLFVDQEVGGEVKRRGLVPRNYETHPVGCYGAIRAFHAVDMPTIPQPEWSGRIRDLEAAEATLYHVRKRGNYGRPIPSRDQNGKGYCWAHSGVSAHLLARARANEPYVDLSAYAIACVIKSFRDEGGWGAQGVDFQAERGCPTSEFWPQQSMSRQNDRPETWANAKKFRPTETWVDLQAAQYDRNLSQAQYATCWLLGEPTINDYNWWGHSVCGVRLVDGVSLFDRGLLREGGKLLARASFDRQWCMNEDMVGAGYGCTIWNSTTTTTAAPEGWYCWDCAGIYSCATSIPGEGCVSVGGPWPNEPNCNANCPPL